MINRISIGRLSKHSCLRSYDKDELSVATCSYVPLAKNLACSSMFATAARMTLSSAVVDDAIQRGNHLQQEIAHAVVLFHCLHTPT